MAILVECPKCGRRMGEREKKKRSDGTTELVRRDSCRCGFALKKASGKIYWIEYYVMGVRRRERIGQNRAAAEQREREVLSRRAEGNFIRKKKDPLFDELVDWYKKLETVQAKKSFNNRDLVSIKKLASFFGARRVSEITKNAVESYRFKRSTEKTYRKQTTKPATINREIACLRRILYMARDEKGIDVLSFRKIRPLDENNVRNRILTDEEMTAFEKVLPEHLMQIVLMARLTAMRKSEILKLTWDKVDLNDGFIYLTPEDTKAKKGRAVPLDQRLIEMLTTMKSYASEAGQGEVPYVFTWNGKPIKNIWKAFSTARAKAGIENFTFHDFRRMCINNWRLQGHDYFRIMAASGHTTMSVFKRYNVVSKKELKALVVPPLDTYMDTTKKKDSEDDS